MSTHNSNTHTEENSKSVLLGITGCIAAYKSCEIVRLLTKAGVDVTVVMTEHATEFVGPTTFRALTGNAVYVHQFDEDSDPISHLALAKGADVFLIAPATANALAKLAHGVADDLLFTVAVANTSPLIVAPAMNIDMWMSASVQENITLLKNRGVTVVEPTSGLLACGDVGAGKLAEVEDIAEAALSELRRSGSLQGKKVVINAGPTQEALDPVRYISNHSSGEMGYRLAREAEKRGAEVVLVSGPVSLPHPRHVKVVDVISAAQMHDATLEATIDADIFIATAAVSDYTPEAVYSTKIKRSEECISLKLSKSRDIIADVVARRNTENKSTPYAVAFAAETDDVERNALEKYTRKAVDMLAVNDVSRTDIGFNSPDNELVVVTGELGSDRFVIEKAPKSIVARKLFDLIENYL